MPELPEVEIARENLERWLVGKRLQRVRVLDPLVLRGQSKRKLERALEGERVVTVGRRAKYLLFDLEGISALAHLGMSGKFSYRRGKDEDPKAARIILELTRGGRVIFADVRRLGRFCLMDEKERKRLQQLGVEPLSKAFTLGRLRELAGQAERPIKIFLLDQSKIAGIGNIQAAESLFLSGIHPERTTSRLTDDELTRLARGIRRSLKRTLRRSRAEEIEYLADDAKRNPFLVYGRKGEPCPRCRTAIGRLVMAGRSTYYCPSCQPLRGRRGSRA